MGNRGISMYPRYLSSSTGPSDTSHKGKWPADTQQILIGINASVVAVAPFKPHRIPPHLLGSGDCHFPWLDGTGHHLERVVRGRVIRLPTNGAWAFFAQQIEGVDTAMPISPLDYHGAIGDMHFDIRWVGFT
jgi:hypothetical protein